MNQLLSPLQIGSLKLKNRIIMSPLTRQRSGSDREPNELMKEYYTQRATAGLIITEATSIHPMGLGYKDTPGIWNDEQVSGWKKITDAVHEHEGKIFLQLWHVGRISDPVFLEGQTPIAPSAIKPSGHVSLLRPKRDYPTPRALETSEVVEIIKQYQDAAKRAKEAGFDGVEIHAANGYLIDQFLQSSTNKRSDEYGGSLEKRARFLLEIIDSILKVWDADRVGVHLAPKCDSHDMGDENPKQTFGHIAKELGKRNIGFIFTRESRDEEYITEHIKEKFGGVVIANQALGVEEAESLLEKGIADAISWGRYYISNPDLVKRIAEDIDFNEFDSETFYSEGAKGYTDYPFVETKA